MSARTMIYSKKFLITTQTVRNKTPHSCDLNEADLTVGMPETNRCAIDALTMPIANLFLNQKAKTVEAMEKNKIIILDRSRAFGVLRTTAKGSCKKVFEFTCT